MPPIPQQRVLEVAVRLGSGAAVTGWGALSWHGGEWFTGIDDRGEARPVAVVGPGHRMSTQQGLVWSSERVDPEDVLVVDGVAVARPVAALTFEVRHAATLTAAVEAMDMAARSDLVSIAEAAAWAAAHRGWTGVERVRRACALADENCWSPAESFARGLWRQARPGASLLANHPVFDLGGRHQLTPDLLDPQAGVAVEYEGRVHLTTATRRRDVVREARYRELGLEVAVMTAPDQHRHDAFLGRLAAAYSRAGRRAAGDRFWTVELPPWWVPTHTVEARRALTDAQRRRWLRRRTA